MVDVLLQQCNLKSNNVLTLRMIRYYFLFRGKINSWSKLCTATINFICDIVNSILHHQRTLHS